MFPRAVKPGEDLPPWYYGFAYREPCLDGEVWLPIPINYAVRILLTVRAAWDAVRAR